MNADPGRPVGLCLVLGPLVRGRGQVSVGQRIAWLVFGLMGLGIAVGIHFGTAWFLELCYGVEAIGPLLCRRLLDLVLLAILGVLLLSNVVTALSSFFLAEDLGLLVSTPIPARPLFASRFLMQVFTSSWMVVAFGLPTLLAFARVAGTPWSYAAIVAALIPLLIFPASVGVAVTLMLVRFMPAARVRNLVAGLLLIAFLVLYLMVRLARPEQFMNPEGFASLIYLLSSLSSPSGVLLPSHWAMTVVGQTFREAPPGQPWLLMLLCLWTGAGASFVLASLAFRRWHAAAYSRSQEGRAVARVSRLIARLRGHALPADGPIRPPVSLAPAGDIWRLVGRLAPAGPLREFLVKDIKLLLRDASQWSQMVLLLALVFVYLYNFRHFRQIGDAGLVGPLALFLIGMGLCGFVTTAVCVRFSFPLISLEGSMLWLLRSAPLRPGRILWAKLLSTLPALLLMAEAMAIISSLILGVSRPLLLLSAGVSALTALSVASLSTGLGAVMPDYKADSAAKVAASFGGLVCMSLSFLVALGLVFAAIYPAFVLHRGIAPRPSILVLSGGLAIALTVASVIVPLRLGTRRLERLDR